MRNEVLAKRPWGGTRPSFSRTHSRTVTSVTLCSATLGEDGKAEPPLGPLYIAAAFEEQGVAVDFRDFQVKDGAHGFSGEALAAFLAGHRELVAISCFVDMLPAVIDATRILHRERPETLFLLGGPGPSASARRIVEKYPWIHGVVRGEGEETAAQWIEFLRGRLTGPIPGMVYRDENNLREGAERKRNRDLDSLPLPAYHLLDWSKYSHARVITTRGCSYRCSFCDVAALWGNRSVYRGLEATIAEMEMLRDRFGKTSIAIVDDTFVLNRERVRSFCRMLLERRANIEWGCFGRINLVTEELADLMAEAGCRAIFYGIDSGSQKVLDRTVKKVRAEDILPVLRFSARCFDKIEASFIWGYPFETLEDFRETLELAGQASVLAPVVNVQMHMLSPLPLSPIYRQYPHLLLEPQPEDRPWLLLPALLLDERSSAIRRLILDAPDIYPGFYAFRTRAKETKRKLLLRAMRALDRTIGNTMFDPAVGKLLSENCESTEQALIAAERHPANRIGVGLALGFFRRVRRREDFRSGSQPFEGTRGPSFARERMELAGSKA